MVVDDILWALVGGTIIGSLAKAAAPGNRDLVPLWLTVICGVGGVLLGTWLYVDVIGFNATTPGLDWWRHVWQVGAAALLVTLSAGITGRRTLDHH
jgi:uncharacterized membrane protein YeaQ/YmgE (transglycosylase-associated protein family)